MKLPATSLLRRLLPGFAALVTLGACASMEQDSQRKPLSPAAREIAVTRTAVLPGSVQDVFAFIAAEDVLPRILTGYGPLPAVVKTSGNTGPWNQPGSARVVHLADGSTVSEQVTQYNAPGQFAYRVWDFGNPLLGALSSGARGDWTFEPVVGGTMVTWTYTFTARNSAAALPLAVIARLLWRGYMDVCLDNSTRILLAQQLAVKR